MNYEKIIDFDNVTIGDCYGLYINQGVYAVIHDGKIINLKRE